MIEYNPKLWSRLIFQFHKSDTLRILLPSLIGVGLFAGLVAYLEIEVFKYQIRSSTIIYSILGFVLSLLLVFRTNTAYDRWWEGRKQWGALVNCSRNLQLKVNSILPPNNHTEKKQLASLISLYAKALKVHLRNRKLDDPLLQPNAHQPNQIAALLFELINKWHSEEKISGYQLLTLNPDLTAFTDICGACERIKNTPIPYSYSLFVKKFIFIYILTMPISMVSEFQYAIVPIVMFVFYVLASLELLAEEIENPFGTDPNDLPTEALCETIRKSVHELADSAQPSIANH